MDGVATPALLPEILGEPPYREVDLRHELQNYVIWLGQEVVVGDLLSALERIFCCPGPGQLKLSSKAGGKALGLTELISDAALTLEAEVPLELLLRSCRVSLAPSRASRPPLSELLHLNTAGGSTSQFAAGMCTAYGPRVSNEDAYICCPDWKPGKGGLFAVCDGHGGAAISQALPSVLTSILSSVEASNPSSDAIKAAFIEADEELRRSLETTADRCGSTCVLGLILPPGGSGSQHRIILANLGDSRGLLYRPRGEWEHLVATCDHKPDVPSEKKRIRAAGGYVIPSDDAQPARLDAVLATSRAFGNFRFKDPAQTPGTRKVSSVPDVSILEGRAGDVLVLTSDGVLDVLSSTEVTSFAVRGLQATGDAMEAAADVVWAALQANTQDNVTCVVVQLQG